MAVWLMHAEYFGNKGSPETYHNMGMYFWWPDLVRQWIRAIDNISLTQMQPVTMPKPLTKKQNAGAPLAFGAKLATISYIHHTSFTRTVLHLHAPQ